MRERVRLRSLPPRRIGQTPMRVIGWPGQIGQTSLAALSQTVKTKSSSGAPGAGELLPRFRPRVARIVVEPDLAVRGVIGCTLPVGMLPAL